MPRFAYRFFTLLLFGLFYFTLSPKAISQGYADTRWYFGNSNLILNFNKGADPTIYLGNDKATPFGVGGSAVATDLNTGNLIFYSDGSTLYDSDNQVFATLLGDSTQNQSVVVLHVPGNENQFYLFYKNTTGELLYAVIDRAEDGTLTVASQDQATGLTTLSEALTLVSGGPVNAPNYWLVAQSGNELKTLEVGTDIAAPLTETSTLTFPFQIQNIHAAADTLNPNQIKWLTLSPATAGQNVQVINLNASTGQLDEASLREIPNSNRNGQTVFDTQWSANGRMLYISRSTSNGANVFQFNGSQGVAADTAVQSVLPNDVAESFGLQTGPDGNIYHLFRANPGDGITLGRLSQTDSAAHQVIYERRIRGGLTFDGEQFPQFLSPIVTDVTITILPLGNACQNQPIVFTSSVINADGEIVEPESYFWEFTNADFSTNTSDISPIVAFPNASPYSAQLTVFVNGLPYTQTFTSNVTSFDVQFTNLPADSTVCELPFTFTAEISGNASIFWNNGDPTVPNPEGTFTKSGTYWAIADNGTCQTFSTLTLRLYGETKTTANIWYFGNQAGIDFNEVPAVALNNSIMNAPEGCAVIGNSNGEILFYTDGQTVYTATDKENNTDHVVMTNGTDIGGDLNSIQSALIAQLPGDETIFYIFTTKEVPNATQTYLVSYTIVDMKRGGGAGEVVSKANPLMLSSSENLSGVGGGGGNVRLYAHELNSNVFRSYELSATGISEPSFITAGSTIGENVYTGYMKLSGTGDILAQALEIGGNQVIELNLFDTLGVYDETHQIILENPVGRIYGMDFSQGNNKLFVSVSGSGNSQIYEFQVDSLAQATETYPFRVIDVAGLELGAIQRAPDGQTYVAVNGQNSLAAISPNENTIDFPTDPASHSSFTAQSFALAGGTSSALGLPNFIQNNSDAPETPGMTLADNACVNTPFAMSASGSSDIDTYEWEVRNANNDVVFTSNRQDTTFIPTLPGIYTVNLTIRNQCLSPSDVVATFSDTFEAFALPDVTGIATYRVICGTNVEIGPDPEAGFVYQWFTGETTSKITVDEVGLYTLRLTNENGCSEDVTIQVAPPYAVDLGPDRSICLNDALTLDAQAAGATYQWFVNNVAVGGAINRTFSVPTNVGGDFTVRVDIADPADPTCTVSDELIVSINELNVSAIATPSSCAGTDGSIVVSITGTDNYTFSWADNAGITTEDRSGLAPGVYTLTVNSDNCTRTLDITVNNTDGFQAEISGETCEDDPIAAFVEFVDTAPSPTFPVTYTVLENGLERDNGTYNGPEPEFFTNELPIGNYAIIIEDAAGCTFSQNFSITSLLLADLQIQAPDEDGTLVLVDPSVNFWDICTTASTVNIPAGSTNGSVSIRSSNNPRLSSPVSSLQLTSVDYGTYEYIFEVTPSNPATHCPTERTLTISFLPQPEFEVLAEEQCNGSVILSPEGLLPAPPNTSYNFQWIRNGQVIANTQTLTINHSGTDLLTVDAGEYTLLVRYDQNLSCSGSATSPSFKLRPPITISLGSGPACEDGEDILLTATTIPSFGDGLGRIFQWIGPDGEVIPNESGEDILVQEEGTYTVHVSYIDGPADCRTSATYTVNRNPLPVSNLEPRVLYCEEESLMVNPGVFESYAWTLPNSGTSDVQSIDVVSEGPGPYSVDLSINGCTITEEFIVIQDCKPQVVVANAFRPASSSDNNVFKVVFNDYAVDFSIFIYNRWGELVFQSEDIAFEWNGTTANGAQAPSGTYAYVIRFASETNTSKTFEQRGAVTLIR
ncbi:gliding motility-associated C-terminal domain-containing protein [Cytophagales bacterium LB-30]|uniref:Gliding motility-associated C-terminal domain-containing protein n=1 Tax=Shiella aurantiaca TaxID=3058365 RepID=A0ABT8F9A6_9BACT|nr:gliding motility-associated C-terminal domain-containing protein [Shiella aurantiaca]MDN4166958.1 gliding motility-associated C-terminal domain-containing protein [Shiella aurantiaca]